MAGNAREWSGEEIQKLQFLMRSGNSFIVDGVTNWSMKHRDGHVVSLTLRQLMEQKYARVIVDSIDLAQIEAVVLLPADSV